jgi:hypothetical protein
MYKGTLFGLEGTLFFVLYENLTNFPSSQPNLLYSYSVCTEYVLPRARCGNLAEVCMYGTIHLLSLMKLNTKKDLAISRHAVLT